MKLITILLLAISALTAQTKPPEPPKAAPVTERARGDYWRAMYTRLGIEMQKQKADAILDAATAALCSTGTPIIGPDGEPVCQPKPEAKKESK